MDERLTHDFDPLAPETFTTAHEMYAELRMKCPVAHSNAFNGFWALFKYEDVVNVLKQPDTFITSVQNVVPKVATTGRRPPLHLDPPEHTPYRRALDPFFTPEKMKQMEPKVRRIVAELMQPLLDAGGGDISSEFGQKLPGHVFAEFFNLTVDQSMRIKEVSKVYNKALQDTNDDLVRETSKQLYDIAAEIIADRKANPRDPAEDVTAALLAKTYQGKPLPDDLVLGTIRQLIVVGMIAPSVFVGNMIIHLSKDQELQRTLREQPELIPAALEEFFRLYTPYRGFARTANKDVVIRGRLIKKDEPIAVVFMSANRDEDVFPEADKFILNRPNIKQHIAFGLGPHQCPGAPLARMMMGITLEHLLKHTTHFEVTGEPVMTRWPEWGTHSVPMRLTRAH